MKKHFYNHFKLKEGTFISQWKYVLDILKEMGIINCKPMDSPMEPNHKLMV